MATLEKQVSSMHRGKAAHGYERIYHTNTLGVNTRVRMSASQRITKVCLQEVSLPPGHSHGPRPEKPLPRAASPLAKLDNRGCSSGGVGGSPEVG